MYVSRWRNWLWIVLVLLSPVVVVEARSEEQSSVVIHVLGVAQDAGNPQINCYEPRCVRIWESPVLGSAGSVLAMVINDAAFHLFDVSPGIPGQLFRLWQKTNLRLADLEGVWLTHAHIGHYAGLIYFGKEAAATKAAPVYAMPKMAGFLASNGPWSQLVADRNIIIRGLTDHQRVDVGPVSVTPWLVPHRDEYSETVGFLIEGPRKTALYLPDIDKWQKWSKSLEAVIAEVDLAFVDATFFSGDELPNRDLSEIPHPTVLETIELLETLPKALRTRVIFTHMNHSNPLLDPDSEASRWVFELGFRIAQIGDTFEL